MPKIGAYDGFKGFRGVREIYKMKNHYLHLSAYLCDACNGPVIAGSTTTRENEISKETDITAVGAICLSCGLRQEAIDSARVRHLLPIAWK
jgi:hypothetical protein